MTLAAIAIAAIAATILFVLSLPTLRADQADAQFREMISGIVRVPVTQTYTRRFFGGRMSLSFSITRTVAYVTD